MHVNVKTAKLKSAAASLAALEKKLLNDLSRVDEVRSRLNTIDNEALRQVAKKLEIQRYNIKVEAYRVNSLKNALEQIVQLYSGTEEKVASYEVPKKGLLNIKFPTGYIQVGPIKPKIIDAGFMFK